MGNNKIELALNKFENIKCIETDFSNLSKRKIKFQCPRHGVFENRIYDFLKSKHGCPRCGKGYSKKWSAEYFKKRAEESRPEYDYSKSEYTGYDNNIIITCPEHGDFSMTPNRLLAGRKCAKCLNEERFLEKLKSKYNNVVFFKKGKVGFNCLKHGLQIRPKNGFLRSGCLACVKEEALNKTKKEYLNAFKLKYGDKFEYLEYTNAKAKMSIRCKEHDVVFSQVPYSHLRYSGCPMCSNYTREVKMSSLLKKLKVNFECHKTFDGCKDIGKLSYDFFIPEKNLLIEINGEQHYEPVKFGNISIEQAIKNLKRQRHHDWLKRKYAQKHNYKLIIISYNEEISEINLKAQLQIKKGC